MRNDFVELTLPWVSDFAYFQGDFVVGIPKGAFLHFGKNLGIVLPKNVTCCGIVKLECLHDGSFASIPNLSSFYSHPQMGGRGISVIPRDLDCFENLVFL